MFKVNEKSYHAFIGILMGTDRILAHFTKLTSLEYESVKKRLDSVCYIYKIIHDQSFHNLNFSH
jgi:membrane-bound metal-dependent hydrolase YbcI (DUF457 family)